MAGDLGIPHIHLVVNRVRGPSDQARIENEVAARGRIEVTSWTWIPDDELVLAAEPSVDVLFDIPGQPFIAAVRSLELRCWSGLRRSMLVWIMVDDRSFRSTVRYFRPEKASGLTVVDVPPEVTARLGGLKQMRVRALVNGKAFTSNTMPGGGGVLALSLNKAILKECGLAVGDEAEFDIERAT